MEKRERQESDVSAIPCGSVDSMDGIDIGSSNRSGHLHRGIFHQPVRVKSRAPKTGSDKADVGTEHFSTGQEAAHQWQFQYHSGSEFVASIKDDKNRYAEYFFICLCARGIELAPEESQPAYCLEGSKYPRQSSSAVPCQMLSAERRQEMASPNLAA